MVWPVIDWSWAFRAFLAHFGLGVILATLLYRFLEFIFIARECRSGFKEATWVGFIGGLFSVGIDLDHFVIFFGCRYARPLHWPLFAVSVLVFLAALLLCVLCLMGNGRLNKNSELDLFRRILCWAMVWPACWIVHVVEDFTLGSF